MNQFKKKLLIPISRRKQTLSDDVPAQKLAALELIFVLAFIAMNYCIWLSLGNLTHQEFWLDLNSVPKFLTCQAIGARFIIFWIDLRLRVTRVETMAEIFPV